MIVAMRDEASVRRQPQIVRDVDEQRSSSQSTRADPFSNLSSGLLESLRDGRTDVSNARAVLAHDRHPSQTQGDGLNVNSQALRSSAQSADGGEGWQTPEQVALPGENDACTEIGEM